MIVELIVYVVQLIALRKRSKPSSVFRVGVVSSISLLLLARGFPRSALEYRVKVIIVLLDLCVRLDRFGERVDEMLDACVHSQSGITDADSRVEVVTGVVRPACKVVIHQASGLALLVNGWNNSRVRSLGNCLNDLDKVMIIEVHCFKQLGKRERVRSEVVILFQHIELDLLELLNEVVGGARLDDLRDTILNLLVRQGHDTATEDIRLNITKVLGGDD